ncbi:YqhR family membrane protein [Ornithinibacillus scapharcae]|uniref:YqhR family membrane protein n=1 Tax=Ornithinibacillus scapharcae TaxID=1147159 RepID=UPI000225AFCB|nr:YqhR family membrane protein [Ornithinibacillus scapharcae]
MEEKKLEQNKQEDSSTFLGRSMLTGFIGGILASLLGLFMYYFNFIEVSPKSYVIRSWTTAPWTDTWLGNVVTILFIGLLSIGVALLYYGIFKKIYSLWMGVAYGILLWAIVFFVLQPIFSNVPSVPEMEINSIVSSICLYILYGTFIGYSISFDYYDRKLSSSNKESKSQSS